MSYNGWTNRETWLVSIWFDPESIEDVEMAQATFEEAYDAMPDFMKDFVDATAINWEELKESMD